MSRHKPTAKQLNELRVAWNAFDADEANYDRLALAVAAVLGFGKSSGRISLETAKEERIDKLPTGDRTFKVTPTSEPLPSKENLL